MVNAISSPSRTCFALALALNLVWTWPLVTDPFGLNIAIQMDAPNTLGLSAAVARAANPFQPELFNWPTGQILVRGDSFVFFLLAKLLFFLPPTVPISLCVLLGPPISAVAAEQLARRLGASFPWSLLAGLAYGFSGLSAMFILEGYAFNLLNPWLPWMALYALKATGAEGSRRDALLAALNWTLCLLTTAYAGISATLLLLAIVGGALLRRSAARATLLTLLGTVLVAGLAFVALYLSAPTEARRFTPDPQTSIAMMTTGSARLATLFWRTPGVDHSLHSQGALIGTTAFLLAIFYPFVPGMNRPGARRLLLVGVALTLLSLGPTLKLFRTGPGMPWLLSPLAEAGLGAFMRFPDRLVLSATLAFGVVGALLLTEIARSRPKAAWALLAAGVFDVLIGAGLPFRTGSTPWEAPSAYAAAPEGRAVLDIWPHFSGFTRDYEVRLSRRAVGYAAMHERPILTDALNVSPVEDRRRPVADWVAAWALSGSNGGGLVQARLDAIGIGAVALHASLFPLEELEVLLQGMRNVLGEPAATSTDQGTTVIVWVISSTPLTTTKAQRLAALELTKDEIR